MKVDDQYCLELLHHAIVQHDVHARNRLQQIFSELLHHWVYYHPKREMACQLNSEDHYVEQALERFWQIAFHHQPEAFDSLALTLRYLSVSLNSTMMEAIRTYSRLQSVPVTEIGDAAESLVEPEYTQYTCWGAIEHILPNMRERRLAYLLFHCGLRPKEIISSHPLEFSDAQEIYRLWPTIAEQLLGIAFPVRKPRQGDKTELYAPQAP
jgi:hypothetical protein